MRKKRFPTIRDVALLAGVSTSTVSHVLNSTRFVSDETKKKVLDAMEEIGYEQNMIARSLRSRKTHTVGLIISDIMNPFYPEIVRGIERELIQNGYSIILTNTDDDVEQEKKLVKLLYGKRVDGFIIVVSGEEYDHIEALVEQNIPVVLLDRTIEQLDVDSVTVDNQGGMYRLVEHLIDKGHKNIGIITGSMATSTGRERFQGYVRALEDHGFEKREEWIKYGEFKRKSGFEYIDELAVLRDVPTAVIASNNLIAVGVLDAIKEREETFLRDIELAVFDEMPWFRHFSRPLSVAVQPTLKIGETAGRLLLEQISGKRKKVKHEVLDVEVRIPKKSLKNKV
jgi:LacI family transcriptional regulator